jgi:hypothetical protein
MSSVVQDNTHEGTVDLKAPVVLGERRFLEFIHEELTLERVCADRLRQRFLRHRRKNALRLVFPSAASKQQKCARQFVSP